MKTRYQQYFMGADGGAIAAERDRLKEINADLLEALKLMADEFLLHINFNPAAGNSEKFHYCLSSARAAIAKAEGQ